MRRHGMAVGPSTSSIDRADELTRRARRLRGRGERRRALVALREACLLDESSAVRWMLYACELRRAGKLDDAEQAMKQSLYRREQAGDGRRAAVVRGLLTSLRERRDSGAFRRLHALSVG